MSKQMTNVYSGGLMYEYAMEVNGYGIVEIPSQKGATVREQPGFARYASALAANPAPSGDGGASLTTHAASVCPTQDSSWLVDSTLLPAIPEGAKVYMKNGAGPGPGLKGTGSQNAGSTSTGDAAPGSGTPTMAPKKNDGVSSVRDADQMHLVLTGAAMVVALIMTLLL